MWKKVIVMHCSVNLHLACFLLRLFYNNCLKFQLVIREISKWQIFLTTVVKTKKLHRTGKMFILIILIPKKMSPVFQTGAMHKNILTSRKALKSPKSLVREHVQELSGIKTDRSQNCRILTVKLKKMSKKYFIAAVYVIIYNSYNSHNDSYNFDFQVV